jgi:hypothetical protein
MEYVLILLRKCELFPIMSLILMNIQTQWCSWLRHCATSQEVAGSIPDRIIGNSLTQSFRPHYGHGVDSASNRNEHQEYFLGGQGGRCIGLTTLLLSCADCLEMWDTQPAGTLSACTGIALPFTFSLSTFYCFGLK